MKKIAFMLCAAAFLGTMSSCSSDSDETVTVTNRGANVTRTLVVTANTLSDFTYGGKTIRSTEATFENAPVNGMLKVTPVSADYFDQDAMSIDFGTQATLAYDVQLAKKPTLEVSQEEMLKGQIVTNDQENSEMTGVKASIQVPSTTQITGNTTSPFSITTYVPTETGQWLTRGENTGEAKVLVIRCAADGAKFSEPVIVTLDIPESDGLDLVCVSEDGKEVAWFRFMIVEDRHNLSATVDGNTDIDSHKSHQQVNMSVSLNGLNVTHPESEIYTVVMQNRRFDNAVLNPKPTYNAGNRLTYEHCRDLIFPAGNEFRRFANIFL